MNSDEIKESKEFLRFHFKCDTYSSCRRHYGLAKFHIELAEYAFGRRHGPGDLGCIYAGLIVNLYNAAELLIETELILLNIHYKDTHLGIGKSYENLVKSGKCPEEFWHVFNKLDGLRQVARYLEAPFSISETKARELLDAVKKQVTYLQEHLSKELW